MPKVDATRVWSLNYQLLMSVIVTVTPALEELGVESKELFLLGELEAHPYPAELATTLCMPKPTVTLLLKRLEAKGFVRREIDANDLRRHRLELTAAGRRTRSQGMTLLSKAFGARLGRLDGAEQAQLRALLEKLS